MSSQVATRLDARYFRWHAPLSTAVPETACNRPCCSGHPFCVTTGANLVSWMVQSGWADSRETAALLGQQLLRNGYIYHVTLSHDFFDCPYYYQIRRHY